MQGAKAHRMTSTLVSHKIEYIPPQTDDLAESSISALHSSPALLVLRDARVLLSNLRFLPYILLPLKPESDDDELNPFRAGAWVLLLQGWLFIVQSTLLLLAPPVFLIFPGLYSSLAVAASLCLIYLTVVPLDGPRFVQSSTDGQTGREAKQHQDERWIFINGCVVG